MRQVLRRSLWLLRRPAVIAALLLVSIGGSALVFVPLFGVPGYELAEALALTIGLAGCIPGIAAAFAERRLIRGQDPRPAGARRYDSAIGSTAVAVGAAGLLNLAALLPPFLTALARSLFATQCDPLANIGFFPMLTLPSALIASAVGVFAGLAARRWWTAGGLYLLVVLATLVATGWPIYFGPQVFAFNHFLGYFPGPLYDEALTLKTSVYWFRVQTVLLAAAAWVFTAFTLDMREGRVRRPHFRPGSAVLLALLLLGAVAIEQQGPLLGLRMTHRHLEDRLGGLKETAHFRIVYFRGKPKEELERLERDLEFRHQQLATFLGGAPNEPINVYVYRSPEEKQQLVGAGGTQFAKPWLLSLHINDAPFPHPVLKHELLHVMAAPFGSGPFRTAAKFGVLAEMAVIEGLAVAGDNRVDDLTLHQWAAAMRKHGLAPDVRRLFAPGGFYTAAASRAYTMAGSFLRYLAETHGTERLRTLYLNGDFLAAYGKPLAELASEYERFIDEVPLDARAEAQAYQRFRRPSIFARACAREVATLEREAAEFLYSDPEVALELYQRIARLQPEEPAYQMGVARSLSRLDRTSEAVELLARLAATLSDKPAAEADVAMLRGDLAWKQGRTDLAVQQYQRVLELQPQPVLDRTARVKLAAVDTPIVGPAINAYFAEGPEDVKLFVLGEALDQAPHDPHLTYLIGRRLTQGEAPALALPYLEQALAKELPETIRKEALRLKIEAHYRAGDCEAVKQQVPQLPDLGVAFELSAREWVERCEYEAQAFKGPLVPKGPFR